MIKRLVGATVVALCFGGAAVSAAVPPTTAPPAAPVPGPAPTQQPTGLGTDGRMDLLAIACFNGTMQACDDLYDESPAGSAYKTFADTCAGRQPAGTGRYCADVFIDTVVQPTSPTTTPKPTPILQPITTLQPTTSVVTSTTITPPTPLASPTDPDLASRIPPVDGYSIAEMPADNVLWRFFDSSLPGEFTRHHALVLAADGAPVAHLVVASGPPGGRPAIDTFVEHTFAEAVQLPLEPVLIDDVTVVTSNGARPAWAEMEGNAVMRAEQEIDGTFQWAWSADDAVWIVRGKSVAEDYVRALLRAQATTLDPYDSQGMTGDLFDYTPTVPGYQYIDLPRAFTLANLDTTMWLRECAERFYFGAVLPDASVGRVVGDGDLFLGLEKASGVCVEDGFLDDVAAQIGSGRRSEQIGGLTVYRDERITQALIGDVLITFESTNPQTYIDMAPFIEQFFAGQPRDALRRPSHIPSEYIHAPMPSLTYGRATR